LQDLEALAPDAVVTAIFHHQDGATDKAALTHTLNEDQILWWQAGSALNSIRPETNI